MGFIRKGNFNIPLIFGNIFNNPSLLGGIPTFNFSLALSTFAAKMAKRTAPGPFDAAPIIQGDFDGSGVPDALSYPRGAQIDTNFYGNFDPYQGSIVFWWTPEKDRDATQTNDETLFLFSSPFFCVYQHDNQRIQVGITKHGRVQIWCSRCDCAVGDF